MAIARNHKNTGRRIDSVGDYRVKVEQIVTGMSKSGKPMLTVTFATDDERTISGYYVKALKWHMAALKDLKVACGLKETDAADMLVGCRCGIAVGEQAPTEDGKIFMQVEGYGKEIDVPPSPHPDAVTGGGLMPSDEVPF